MISIMNFTSIPVRIYRVLSGRKIAPLLMTVLMITGITLFSGVAHAEGEDGSSSEVMISSLYLFSKQQKGLLAEKLFVVVNRSDKPYSLENLRLHLPDKAKDVEAGILFGENQESRKIKISRSDEGWILKAELPQGNSTLMVHFFLEGHQLTDSLPDFRAVTDQIAKPDEKNFRVVGWKPVDARPSIVGAGSTQEIQVPHVGPAMKVTFPAPGVDGISNVDYDFSDGSFLSVTGTENHKSTLLGSFWLTALSLVLALGITIIALGYYHSTYRKGPREQE